MARRRRATRRFVKGRPNYVWVSVAGQQDLEVTASSQSMSEQLLIPSDWQTLDTTNTSCTLCHLVYSQFIYGLNVNSAYSWSGQYAVFLASDVATGPIFVPGIGDPITFAAFMDTYERVMHWGQFTAMPYVSLPIAATVHVAGGSAASMQENMLNLNARRILKGDDCVRIAWQGYVPVVAETYNAFWFVRALLRTGLK